MRAYHDLKNQSLTLRLGEAAVVCLLMVCHGAWANPSGGRVVSGSASVRNSGNTTTITQTSDKAIINWQDFSVGAGQTTQFKDPSSSSVTLNRVTGGNPSAILGALKSNGIVYIINPNGILFGTHSTVDVGGLVASTSQISNQSFLSGTQQFTPGNVAGASIINQGKITVAQAGMAVLVSPTVINQGIISANLGTVAIASADHFTLDLYGDNLISFDTGAQLSKGLIANYGTIQANGGRVMISAQAAAGVLENVINMNGYIDCSNATAQGGKVILQGEGNTQLNMNGNINVSSAANQGGLVQATAQTVNLGSDSVINASGYTGGGTVNIGGELHGGGTLAHADTVDMNPGALIYADAWNTGNGGTVSLWSDQNTNAAGSIFARGGALSGNGGMVETSSENTIDLAGLTVNTSAAHGNFGTFLIDPVTLTITDSIDSANQISANTINSELLTNNVNISTSDGIEFDNTTVNISWNTASNLSMRSNDAAHSIGPPDNDTDTITFAGGCTALSTCQVTSAGSGNIDFFYNPTSYATPTDFSGYVHTTGTGVFTPYMEVNTASELQSLNTNLAGQYALNTNIDLTSISNFQSIGGEGAGDFTGQFTGNIQGNQYNISNLNINTGLDDVGLFGSIAAPATISNVVIGNASINGGENVGAIIGADNGATLDGTFQVTSNGTQVRGTSDNVGGLIGYLNGGTVNSDVVFNNAGNLVQGVNNVGGLVGNFAPTTFSSTQPFSNAAGVIGTGSNSVAGIFGLTETGITMNNDFSNSGNISGTSSTTGVGGLFSTIDNGTLTGNLSNTGSVTGGSQVGGLIGYVVTNSTLSGTLTSGVGTVTGTDNVGGLIGEFNFSFLDGNATHTSGDVTGSDFYVGGVFGAFENGSMTNPGVKMTNLGGNVSGGGLGVATGGVIGWMNGNIFIDPTSVLTNYANVSGSIATGGVAGEIDGPNTAQLINYGNVTGSGMDTGGIVGFIASGGSGGSISNALEKAGTVTGDTYVGGIAGENDGNINQSAVASGVTIIGNSEVGGIAGYNSGSSPTPTIQDVSFGGTVVANTATDIGGIAGLNEGTILQGLSVGTITASGGNIGQLVGNNQGDVENSVYNTQLNQGLSAFGVNTGTSNNIVGGTFASLSTFNTYAGAGFSPSIWQVIPGSYASLIWCGDSCLIADNYTPTPSSNVAQVILSNITMVETWMNSSSVNYVNSVYTAGTELNIIPATSVMDQMAISTDSPYYGAVNNFMQGTTYLQWLDNTTNETPTQTQNNTIGAIKDAVGAEQQAQGCAVK